MQNPWQQLPTESPYVLRSDLASIKEFNAKLKADRPARFDVNQVIPEPFAGNVTSSGLVLLQLNPGSCDEEAGAHAAPDFRAALLANLRHESSPWPFYFLDPKFRERHPGGRWWSKKLRKLIDAFPVTQISQQLAVVEWFPYKSRRFKVGCRVPSQEYGFWLVRQAIEREAVIVVSRAVKRWEASVPELQTYPRKLTLSSAQNVAVTPNNLKLNGIKSPAAWDLVIEALARH